MCVWERATVRNGGLSVVTWVLRSERCGDETHPVLPRRGVDLLDPQLSRLPLLCFPIPILVLQGFLHSVDGDLEARECVRSRDKFRNRLVSALPKRKSAGGRRKAREKRRQEQHERSALPPRGLGWRDSSRPSAGRQRGRVAGWAARLTLKQFFALPRNPLARRRIFSLRILSSTRAPSTPPPVFLASGPVLPVLEWKIRGSGGPAIIAIRDGRSCRRARGLLARRRCPVRLGSGWGVGLPQGGHASPGQEGAVQSGAPPLPPGRPGDPH